MKLSAPIHVLRSRAKNLKQERNLTLVAAQNEIAQQEGFASWSLLMSRRDDLLPNNLQELRQYLNSGDMVLVGARPKLGKTMLTADLLAAGELSGERGYIFTLADRLEEAEQRIKQHLEESIERVDGNRVQIDCSDEICADYIIDKLQAAESGSLVIIDYLQLLSEDRRHPSLQDQIEKLVAFARSSGCIIVVLAQLDRDVDARPMQCPSVGDIRLRNLLDTQLFNKVLFLYRPVPSTSQTVVSLVRPVVHELAAPLEIGAFRHG